jgi:hypothetical protein
MKVFVAIKSTGEKTLKDCIKSVEERGFDYAVFGDKESLEEKVKKILKFGVESSDKYEWIMSLDADVVLTASREFIEEMCCILENTEKIDSRIVDNFFSFTSFINCTKRGIVSGIRFYRTMYCKVLYEMVENKDFSYHKGREESEMCNVVRNEFGFSWESIRPFIGIHYWEVNNKTK